MKKLIFLLLGIVSSISMLGQAPNSFNYQAVIRNSDGTIKQDESVAIQIEILQGSIDGSSVYLETHNTSTNSFGLVTLEIGAGTTSGDLSSIDWGDGPYFLELTLNGASIGASQLLSVPYSLHAKSAETITGDIVYNETDPIFSSWDKNSGVVITESQISDLQAYLTNEVDPAFAGWDKSSGIVITESQISDLKTYLTTETDPAYTVSEAANITSTDITNLGNLSGTNTGDQDLSSYATKDMGNQNITNLANPFDDQDAATKAYVDALEVKIEMLYNSLNAGGKVTDIDDNSYNTVKIGTQIWMAENLKTTKYNDGTDIPLVSDSLGWSNLTTPGYCWYNNDSATYGTTYGALYNWYSVNTNKLCPSGWHVPNNSEFFALWNLLGGYGLSGAKLKMKGTLYWNSPNTGATNETGFTALPGGYRDINGFKKIKEESWFVSSEVINGWVAIFFAGYNMTNLNYGSDTFTSAFSVRCVKD